MVRRLGIWARTGKGGNGPGVQECANFQGRVRVSVQRKSGMTCKNSSDLLQFGVMWRGLVRETAQVGHDLGLEEMMHGWIRRDQHLLRAW